MITAATAAPGAVYVVFAPLAVCAGVNVPHVPVGVQVQSTPAFAESFVTVALTDAVPFTRRDEGGAVVKEMATVLFVAAEIVMVATAIAVWVLVEVAVIVTLAAALGAV
jgi:hypothetical protein